MAIIGIRGNWIRVNKRVCEIIGYTEAELLQLTFQDITHPDDLKSDLSLLTELIEGTRENYQLEKRYLHKNGNIVWVVLAVSMVKNHLGDPIHFVSQINDITEQKMAQQRVIENHNKLVDLLNATEQVIIIGTTTNGLITTFNKGAENLLGYTSEEILNQHTPVIFHKHEEIIARGSELSTLLHKEIQGFDVFIGFAKQGQFESRDWTYVRKDGSEFPVQLVVTAQKNTAGDINGYLGVATDISKIKNAETKLIEINQMVEAVNRQLLQKNKELEQFAYVAAHDLQEPLRMISSFLSLIEQKYNHQLDDKGKLYIQYTVDGALRMRNIITDILDFSKAGIVNNIMLDLNDVVAKIIADFKSDNKYNTAEISMDTLPTISADATAMQQLFINLIGNALKYQLADNNAVIKISVEDNDDKWLFKVADNGIGINPQYYDKVFAIFKRLHAKSEYSGTGIGLATCKKIVTIYNGDIWITPNINTGSIFCFTLGK
jgi:PAS domain S-box-containing protein